MSYLPQVAWSSWIMDVAIIDATNYSISLMADNQNEPGGTLEECEIGYYVRDNIGNTYKIVEILTATPLSIKVFDELNVGVGPQQDRLGYIYKPVGDGDGLFIAPIPYNRLSPTALETARPIELDVLWKSRGIALGSDINITKVALTGLAGAVTVGSGWQGGNLLTLTLVTATDSILGGVKIGDTIGISSGVINVLYGSTSNTACVGNDARLSDARTPLSHTLESHTTTVTLGKFLKGTGTNTFGWADHGLTYSDVGASSSSHAHGNITNLGYLGSSANTPLITGAAGVIQAGSFGSSANTFCVGNDPRLSDARTPTLHALENHTAVVTSGKLLKGTGVNTFGWLSLGSSLQVLRVNSTGNDVEWASPFSGTVTSVGAGGGMSFSTITSSGNVILGTPSTCSGSTSNSVTASSHTHAITGFEPSLGNPAVNNYVLVSSTSGIRSWVNSSSVLDYYLTTNYLNPWNTSLGYAYGFEANMYYNVVVGYLASGGKNGSGYNTILGAHAFGGGSSYGSRNVMIGYGAGYGSSGDDQLKISNNVGTPLISGNFATGEVAIQTKLSIGSYMSIGSYNSVGADTGYVTLPGGIIVQYGVSLSTLDTTEGFTFPFSFPNYCFSVICDMPQGAFKTYSRFGFSIDRLNTVDGSVNFHWIAFGN